ncbi:MAG: hypothetical protein ABI810_07230 [Sphingomonas bacterium]
MTVIPTPTARASFHALADSYATGAVPGSHDMRRIELAMLDFPLLRSREAWENQSPPAVIAAAQADLAWVDRLAILYSGSVTCRPFSRAFSSKSFAPASPSQKARDPAAACCAASRPALS